MPIQSSPRIKVKSLTVLPQNETGFLHVCKERIMELINSALQSHLQFSRALELGRGGATTEENDCIYALVVGSLEVPG